jgi:hypothetical protein
VTSFSNISLPTNHIPYSATATCDNCHTSSNYATMPTIASIHLYAPSTTTNCTDCHSTANAAKYAIPSASFTIVTLPNNHIPTTLGCEICHVGSGSSIAATPVPNGAKFSGSKMSHKGITTNCVSCHVTSGTVVSFAGITKIIGMPPTTPMGASSHIPSSSTCEACHSASTLPALIPASATTTAPGTLFNNPLATGIQIHTGITTGCNACHNTGYIWMGVSSYPITPATMSTTVGTQYKGFQTRPTPTGSTYAIKDAGHPTGGDCSDCHTGTTYFDGAAKPTGHIPTTASCSQCHIVAGDYSVAGLASNAILHTGITNNCRTCHVAGTGAGPFAGCTTKATCTSPVPLTYQPMIKPGGDTPAPNTNSHIPVGTQSCELCHGSTIFTNFTLPSKTSMRPNTTNTGHATGTQMHTLGVPYPSFTCMSCHETPYTWLGVTIRVRDSANHHKGQDCYGSNCHSNTSSQFKSFLRPKPIMRAAVGAALQRVQPQAGLAIPGVNTAAGARYDHRGVVVGQCKTCHDGQTARGRPLKHYGNRMSCDSCHRTSAWIPAQFSHQGVVAGQCASCHNGVDASTKPSEHFVSVRACDSCHRPLAWVPVRYQHLSPSYQFDPSRSTCISCHVTNGEIIPRQLHGNPRNRPTPVKPGP